MHFVKSTYRYAITACIDKINGRERDVRSFVAENQFAQKRGLIVAADQQLPSPSGRSPIVRYLHRARLSCVSPIQTRKRRAEERTGEKKKKTFNEKRHKITFPSPGVFFYRRTNNERIKVYA